MVGIARQIFDADIRSVLLYHTTRGRISTNDLDNEAKITTLLDSQALRINRYANNIFSVNCIPIIRKDQLASNGIIHVIDGILLPAKNWPLLPIPQALAGDGRFRELSHLFLQSSVSYEISRDSEVVSYTLFAPFDEAFHKMSPSDLDRYTKKSTSRNGMSYKKYKHFIEMVNSKLITI